MIRAHCRWLLLLALGEVATLHGRVIEPSAVPAAVLRVGPQHAITRIEEASRVAGDGTLVLLEPGDYVDDVASWPQNNLTIRAHRCCARFIANGRSAEDKAIFVVKGNDVTIENIEFHGARVPDRNGAGIRHEGPGLLTVRDCRFTGNEMGLLSSNDPKARIVIERSEFDNNRIADTHAGHDVGHQIYIGRIASLTLRESYVHHGYFGHLVKSRARENFIYNNRLTDEEGGRASYELEFPDGGIAFVVGNVIAQSRRTENSTIVSFGAERFHWQHNELYLVNNTLVDTRPRSRPTLAIRPGADVVYVTNNLLIGAGVSLGRIEGRLEANATARSSDVANAREYDFRLRSSSPQVGRAARVTGPNAKLLALEREYVHPRGSRDIGGAVTNPGAVQSTAR
ncbi:MAG TPA: right-handed parallel beta-helix repeat-containing protein [Casimicrobiaceae bacterium]|nr:right-handed parallel beta-helix repeat-containing protein [Casimicrobiaceae bacterium]